MEKPGSEHQSGLERRYSNFVLIQHNVMEFMVSFAEMIPGQGPVKLEELPAHTRVVLSPVVAKQLLNVLSVNVARYEEQYGAIPGERQRASPPGEAE